MVDNLGERNGKGGRDIFFHDVSYKSKERKQKSSILFRIAMQGKEKKIFCL